MRGLRNSRAPISGLDRPSRARRAICSSCGRELVAGLDGALAHLLAGGQQLAAGRARRTPPCRSRRTCRARRAAARARRRAGPRGAATRRTADARGRAPGAAASGRAARSPRGTSARRPRPSLSSARERASMPSAQSVPAARRRLRRAARGRAARDVGLPAPDGGLDQLGQRPGGQEQLGASRARLLGRRQRLLVAAEAVVEDRGRPAGVLHADAPGPRRSASCIDGLDQRRRPRPLAPGARRAAWRRRARCGSRSPR